tara:strand:+ start:1243 stop:1452 length:210 start_codon:yes stop_codon:yes gene_type:complete
MAAFPLPVTTSRLGKGGKMEKQYDLKGFRQMLLDSGDKNLIQINDEADDKSLMLFVELLQKVHKSRNAT